MPKTIISAEPDSLASYLNKIWQHKSLIVTLAKRDLKIKYAQTTLGLAWTVLQPLVAVIVYTLFFSVLMDFETEYPYVLFVLSGILLWGLFNYIFSQGSACLYQNQELIKKLSFPKIILPLSKAIGGLVEFAITSLIFVVLFLYYEQVISIKLLIIPLLVALLSLFSLGLALLLNAFTLKNRDLNHIIPFFINFGIWLTPVFYPVSILPEGFKNLIYINPIAAIIQLFRWSMFNDTLNPSVFIGLCLSFLIFILGVFSFKKMEDKIIDLL
ncbi:MAG: lipopolysaccharide transport system permease protein [Chitinophagales bacterium]|jgi:lipopolysaccharide transport system permease protein